MHDRYPTKLPVTAAIRLEYSLLIERYLRIFYKIDEKYRSLIGEPTPVQERIALKIDSLAKDFKMKNMWDPFNRYPKEEPAKRYLYLKNKTLKDSDIPYTTESLSKNPFSMKWSNFRFSLRGNLLKLLRKLKSSKSNPEVDDYLIKAIRKRNFCVAF